MNRYQTLAVPVLLASWGLLFQVSAARADLVLSQMVVELAPAEFQRSDIELWNNGPDRTFVEVDPREIIAPGTADQSSRKDPDPEKLGLLVSPERIVLEPGQRRLLRIAALGSSDRERVYRVTVKPVVSDLSSQQSGLKLLVGYDVLVIVRPPRPMPHVTGTRAAAQLSIRNDGNVSVELVDGRACDESMRSCSDLPSRRLYAGAATTVNVGGAAKVRYDLKLGSKLIPVAF